MCPSRGWRSLCPARPALCLLVFALALLQTPLVSAVSNADLIAYLGGTATGQTLTTVAYSLTMLANDTSVLVSLSVDRSMGDVGWLGWGHGTAMTDADILVLWPNADGSWTLSHRTAASTVMPTLVGSPSSDPSADSSGQVRVVVALSSAEAGDSPCVVTVERRLSLEDVRGYGGKEAALEKAVNQPVIYAYGADNPGKSAQDTDLKQHALDAMGGTYDDLSAAFTADTAAVDPPLSPVEGGSTSSGGSSTAVSAGASGTKTGGATAGGRTGASPTALGSSSASTGGTGSSSSGTTSSSTPASSSSPSYTTLITAHGVCAGTAWAFFAPLGALYARLGRGPMGRVLFPLHFKQQGYVTTPLTLFAFGLVLWAVKAKGGSSLPNPHKTVGFCLTGLLVVQDALGLWTHLAHKPAPRGGGPAPRAVQGYLHIFLGVTLVCLGFYQVHLGLERYGVSDKVVLYGYYGAAALFSLIYGGSFLLSFTRGTAAPPATGPSHASHARHHRRSSSGRKHRRRKAPRRRKKRPPREESSGSSGSDSETSEADSDDSLDRGHMGRGRSEDDSTSSSSLSGGGGGRKRRSRSRSRRRRRDSDSP